MAERTVHHGRNIKRIREIQGIKQEALALELGDDWNQKKISLLEAKETIDDALLNQIASVLRTTPDAIKNFDEAWAISVIGNSYYDNSTSNVNYLCTFNPIEKYVEMVERNTQLYERLLQTEREKLELLERLLKEKKWTLYINDGLSQGELGKAADTSGDITGKYERNEVKPSVEVAAKIADELEVSLDFLVGKTSVEVDTKTLRRLQDIQKLNDQDKTTVLEMVDAFLRDRKTKKHYAD